MVYIMQQALSILIFQRCQYDHSKLVEIFPMTLKCIYFWAMLIVLFILYKIKSTQRQHKRLKTKTKKIFMPKNKRFGTLPIN